MTVDTIVRVTRPVPPFLLGFGTPALQVGDLSGLDPTTAARLVKHGVAVPVDATA